MSLQLHNDYKYITMIHDHDLPKTSVFDVYTKNEKETYLGEIRWYAPWRQYCFMPNDECVFSRGCMNDINDFITRLMDIRKKGSQSIDNVSKALQNNSTESGK